MIAKTILHYTILEKLGEGGMFKKQQVIRHAESRRKSDQSTDWLDSASSPPMRSRNKFGMTTGEGFIL